jgi:hypothetical protein
MRHDRQVVADEQEGQPEVALQLFQQVQDVGLDRDIERGHAFVGHHEFRPDTSARAIEMRCRWPPGEGMREAAQMFEVEPALGGDLAHPLVGFLAALRQAHHLQRLGDDVAHGHARAERGIGVLKDQLRALAVGLESAPW